MEQRRKPTTRNDNEIHTKLSVSLVLFRRLENESALMILVVYQWENPKRDYHPEINNSILLRGYDTQQYIINSWLGFYSEQLNQGPCLYICSVLFLSSFDISPRQGQFEPVSQIFVHLHHHEKKRQKR